MTASQTSRWTPTRLKWLVDPLRPVTYGIVQAGEDVPEGVPYIRPVDMADERGVSGESLRRTSPEIASAYSRSAVKPGDLVVSIGPSFGKVMVVPPELDGANLTQGTARVAPSGVYQRFLFWALRSLHAQEFWDAGCSGATFRALTLELLNDTPIYLPTADAQRAIADFLDRKTPAIDELIEKKERLVAAAEERRAALISEVVLGALSPAKRRGTGTSLGVVPEHWATKRLMHLTPPGRPIMYGIVLPGPNVDDGVPIVKSGNCTRDTLRPELLHKTTFEIEAGYARSRLAKDDVVYAIRGSVGMAALVPEDVAGANPTQDAARIAPGPDVNPRWLLYVVQSAPVWAQLAAGIVGATVKGINIRDLKRPFVPVPPRREQDEIAAYLDAEVGKLHALEATTEQSIEHLREYRQALITAAVTGQIDVATREAA